MWRSADVWSGAALACLGAALFAATAWIDFDQSGLVGPRAVPRMVCGAMIALGLVLALGPVLRAGRPVAVDAAMEESGDEGGHVWRAAAVIALGLLYVPLLGAFGYLVSTALEAAAVLLLFGLRSPVRVVGGAVLVACLWYVAFVKLMGVFDPPGSVFSLSF